MRWATYRSPPDGQDRVGLPHEDAVHGLVDPHSLVEALRDGQEALQVRRTRRRRSADSKRYLKDFDRLQQSTTTDEELFNEMTKRYLDRESNHSWLMFGFPSFPEPTED